MPGFDRTGPEGQGPRTGRQMGKCVKPDEENSTDDNQSGRGLGRGMGRGVGRAGGRAHRMRWGRGGGRGMGRR